MIDSPERAPGAPVEPEHRLASILIKTDDAPKSNNVDPSRNQEIRRSLVASRRWDHVAPAVAASMSVRVEAANSCEQPYQP